MCNSVANLPIRWFKGVPTTYWTEGDYRVSVHLWKRKYRFKITCLKCRKNMKDESSTLINIKNMLKDLKLCHH
jgi:hypothetical protein